MQKSTITIDVHLDDQKVPEQINWNASDTTAEQAQQAKALCLAFWDGVEKSAMRIDLWTKTMMMDEMGDFFYQIMMTMADTLKRATHQEEISDEMKAYAKSFHAKFQAVMNQQKLSSNQ